MCAAAAAAAAAVKAINYINPSFCHRTRLYHLSWCMLPQCPIPHRPNDDLPKNRIVSPSTMYIAPSALLIFGKPMMIKEKKVAGKTAAPIDTMVAKKKKTEELTDSSSERNEKKKEIKKT